MSAAASFGDALSSAIRYWEPRRLLYNGVLLVVLAGVAFTDPQASFSYLSFNALQLLFVLAVLANVAYCGAYAIDVPVQMSTARAGWLKARWVVLAIGILFAAVIAGFFARGLLSPPIAGAAI